MITIYRLYNGLSVLGGEFDRQKQKHNSAILLTEELYPRLPGYTLDKPTVRASLLVKLHRKRLDLNFDATYNILGSQVSHYKCLQVLTTSECDYK